MAVVCAAKLGRCTSTVEGGAEYCKESHTCMSFKPGLTELENEKYVQPTRPSELVGNVVSSNEFSCAICARLSEVAYVI